MNAAPLLIVGTFAALAASHFAPVRLVGVVGRDWPEAATAMLKKHHVDTHGLEVDSSGDTFHWEGRYSPDLSSRESLATDLNVFARFSPKIPPAFKQSHWVMLGNIHPALQLEVLKQIEHRPKLVVADTMNFWITGERPALLRTLTRVDVLVINDEEARQLSGEHNLVRAARGLMSLGPRVIIVKKGEHGALLFEGDEVFSAPAYPTMDVLDPTGAGDTFAGGLIGYIASRGEAGHDTLRRAVVNGSALASFSVEGVGTARLETLTRPEIATRIERFKRLVHFGLDAGLAD